MAKVSPAVNLQKELLEKGFRSIEFCDDQDDGMVTISHYFLTKEKGPSQNTDSCLIRKWYDLEGEEAVQILEKWMAQIVIFPDPRVV